MLFRKDGGELMEVFSYASDMSMEQATEFLAKFIHYWMGKERIFDGFGRRKNMSDGKPLPEEEWEFMYFTPPYNSTENYILRSIFHHERIFNELCFVHYNKYGCGEYSFKYDILKYFSKNGHDKTVEKYGRKIRKPGREKELKEKLQRVVVFNAMQQWFLKYFSTNERKHLVCPLTENIGVAITSQCQYENGCFSFYDQVRLFCGSQEYLEEVKWGEWSSDNGCIVRQDIMFNYLNGHYIEDGQSGLEIGLEMMLNGSVYRNITFYPERDSSVKTKYSSHPDEHEQSVEELLLVSQQTGREQIMRMAC